MQLLLGVFFEYTHAYKKIASIYILSVIAGALFKTAINTVTNYAGAPSAVLALFLSQFVDYLMNWRALKKWREMKIPFVRICGAMVYIVHSFVLFSVEAAIDDPQVHHHYSDRISHFIGGISGMCLSSLLVKQVHLEDWQTTFQALSALALMILILPLIIIIMLQYPLPPPPPPTIYDDSGPFYLL
ncbi:Rhomboid-related protein 3 [Pseudolycoriella hygida]|uniref:Rhomboid-related protein 3 n=2 Tax=Pseudolycoriella hygida TaxID=35572 RepID=A0A9Q0SAG7_9DIPT